MTHPTIHSRQPLDETDIEIINDHMARPLRTVIASAEDYTHPDIVAATKDLLAALSKFEGVVRAGAEV